MVGLLWGQVEKDGSCDLVEVSLMSGRFFLGMSAILTQGEKVGSVVFMSMVDRPKVTGCLHEYGGQTKSYWLSS